MTIQHLNDVKTIARAANLIGATLPTQIVEALAHLDDLTRNAPAPARPGALAKSLAQHIGEPEKMDKALKAAAVTLAAADAEAKIRGFLAETCGAQIRGMLNTRRRPGHPHRQRRPTARLVQPQPRRRPPPRDL